MRGLLTSAAPRSGGWGARCIESHLADVRYWHLTDIRVCTAHVRQGLAKARTSDCLAGAKVGLTNERFNGTERVYVRYGSATVLFARFFSILRQLNGIVAGVLGMSWWRFVLLDAVGAALWVTIWVFAPAYFSEHLTFIVGLAHHTKVVASFLLAIGLMLVLGLFIRRLRVAGWTERR